jgi:hypothetical protein
MSCRINPLPRVNFNGNWTLACYCCHPEQDPHGRLACYAEYAVSAAPTQWDPGLSLTYNKRFGQREALTTPWTSLLAQSGALSMRLARSISQESAYYLLTLFLVLRDPGLESVPSPPRENSLSLSAFESRIETLKPPALWVSLLTD